MDKREYMDKPSKAYFSGFSGIEIKAIQYGIDDYIIFIAGAWTGKPSIHKSKVYYNSRQPYFKYKGIRIKLNDCIRMGG